MVPNHALIIHALLHGDDDFQKSLMIVNTCGWDTDCNSGNVGCLLGIKNGLAGLETGPDWRGPVADRLYLPTADGGRAISDAVTESVHVVNIGRALAGEAPLQFKEGARFHFELPGASRASRWSRAWSPAARPSWRTSSGRAWPAPAALRSATTAWRRGALRGCARRPSSPPRRLPPISRNVAIRYLRRQRSILARPCVQRSGRTLRIGSR